MERRKSDWCKYFVLSFILFLFISFPLFFLLVIFFFISFFDSFFSVSLFFNFHAVMNFTWVSYNTQMTLGVAFSKSLVDLLPLGKQMAILDNLISSSTFHPIQFFVKFLGKKYALCGNKSFKPLNVLGLIIFL